MTDDHVGTFTPEARTVVLKRRLVTIPRSIVIFILVIALAPVLILVAVIVDGVRLATTRKPAMTLRLLAFGFVFFAVELIGLARLFGSWALALGNPAKLRRDAWPIQVWWAETLLAAVKRIFQIELSIVGQETAAPGPVIAMFRHASIVDNLLPAVLLTADLGIRLRWVVKRELLTLPSLDVAGKRLPNYFVDRNSTDPRSELKRIRALGNNLGANDGVLIYPEGTRFTPERFNKAIARMKESGDRMAERAIGLRYVMPPRPGGTLTLLDSNADVVVGAHQGLEGFAKLGDLWSGALVGKTINVRLTRISASEIPKSRRDRTAWLYGVWEEIDAWIAERVQT
ncbi:MAG: hypothetical protein HKN91_01360 [Acidimicrobiia bacterium]|nr:hypothetical protein [Acidimicrobiia bacterium]